MNVLGGIQEDALRKVVEDNVDDGLVQRLFVIMLRPAVLGKDEPGWRMVTSNIIDSSKSCMPLGPKPIPRCNLR